ncbi:MAG: RbsD/FucU family protein [Christensenellales bacterium]
MLKGIPSIISPDLLKILMEMGHGDELVIGDGTGASCTACTRTDIGPELLEAILKLYPLDTYSDPVYIMQKVPGDNVETPIWKEFEAITGKYTDKPLTQIERFEFYERAKEAYAVVTSGETALYANIIIRKGVVVE